MKATKRTFWKWLGRNLRRQFLAGVLAIIPIGVTAWILIWIFNNVDNILQPAIRPILGRSIPGVGFGITILLIYLIGVVATNVIGRRLIGYGESILARVPVVRQLYSGIKQLVEGFSAPGSSGGFTEAVLVEFPRKGMWTIGFITNETVVESGERQLNIFIPTAPNPTSGFLQIASEEEVIRTGIPVDDAVRMVISAGKVSSPAIIKGLPVKTRKPKKSHNP